MQTTGILVFEEESACEAAINAAAGGTVLELTPAEPEGSIGLKSWVNAHKVSSLAASVWIALHSFINILLRPAARSWI